MSTDNICIVVALAVFSLGMAILNWRVLRDLEVRGWATWDPRVRKALLVVIVALVALLLLVLCRFGFQLVGPR